MICLTCTRSPRRPPSVSLSYKADLWRYCALFTFGGWFLDAEDVPLLRLSALHRPCDRLVLVRDQCPERDDAQATGPCRQPAVQISLLGAAPRHPFLSCCLAMAVRVRRPRVHIYWAYSHLICPDIVLILS